jgi:hypothetical protein
VFIFGDPEGSEKKYPFRIDLNTIFAIHNTAIYDRATPYHPCNAYAHALSLRQSLPEGVIPDSKFQIIS